MRRTGLAIGAMMALAGCGGSTPAGDGIAQNPDASMALEEERQTPPVPAVTTNTVTADAADGTGGGAAANLPGLRWQTLSSPDGTALRLSGADERIMLGIACTNNPDRLVVMAPALARPDRPATLSIDLGGDAIALDVDPQAQAAPGVTAEGPIPSDFAARLRASSGVTIEYGSQRIGPYVAPGVQAEQLIVGCAAAA